MRSSPARSSHRSRRVRGDTRQQPRRRAHAARVATLLAVSIPLAFIGAGGGVGELSRAGFAAWALRCPGRGAWRSLVSALVWGTKVPSSNLGAPIDESPAHGGFSFSSPVRLCVQGHLRVTRRGLKPACQSEEGPLAAVESTCGRFCSAVELRVCRPVNDTSTASS